MNMPDRDYITRRTAQLEATFTLRDGPAAVAVVELIRADGYAAFADLLVTELVERGLENMAAKAGVR